MYPNGVGTGKNTHLFVFFILMKGDYDEILPWPFQKKVTFILFDQQEVVSVTADPTESPKDIVWQKPLTRNNIGKGVATFVSQEKLKKGRFIVDDTIIHSGENRCTL